MACLVFIAVAIVTRVVGGSARVVNISNTWMLPEEGFPVFYRYFRDRISWYEADAVCQFHHANLVTADTTSQYDAIRAYLKELDIIDNVWIGLSKTPEKPNFTWTNFQPLTGDGHWYEAPSSVSQDSPLCVATDAAADFRWHPLPCGGPDIASFICELPIPLWAAGPKGCLLTELPSLTVLYVPEQSALELTSDCGLDGTKRIACKGDADREEMLKQLACSVSSEEFDEKSTKPSLVLSTEYESDSSTEGRSTKSSLWTSNTVDLDYGMPTRHRRETEDTLSPITTKSSFGQESTTDLSWKLHHPEVVSTLNPKEIVSSSTTSNEETTRQHSTSTPLETSIKTSFASTMTEKIEITSTKSTSTHEPSSTIFKSSTSNAHVTTKPPEMTQNREKMVTTTTKAVGTTKSPEILSTTSGVVEKSSTQIERKTTPEVTTKAPEVTSVATMASVSATREAKAEEYPSAINQGQLFSIIENGTMFDIIELNESNPIDSEKSKSSTAQIPTKSTTNSNINDNINLTTLSPPLLKNLGTKNKGDKKKIEKDIVTTKKPLISKKYETIKGTATTQTHQSTTTAQTFSTTTEDLNKEFEMLPIVKDSSVKLNRTFRKELPPMDSEENNEYSVPKVIDFSISNSLINNNDPNIEINFHDEKNYKNITQTLVVSSKKRQLVDDRENIETNPIIPQEIESLQTNNNNNNESTVIVIDPKLEVLNSGDTLENKDETETVLPESIEEQTKLAKRDFLPSTLLGDGENSGENSDNNGQNLEDPQKRPNRKRQLSRPSHKVSFPYIFSRMLG